MDVFTPRFQDCAAKTESQIRSSDISELHSPEEEEMLVERMWEPKEERVWVHIRGCVGCDGPQNNINQSIRRQSSVHGNDSMLKFFYLSRKKPN